MSEINLSESRCANTIDMLTLYSTARTLDLNRNLEPATVAALDLQGVHVLTMVLVDHRAAASRQLPLHHRTSTLLKLRDRDKPFVVFLDVTDEQWRKLLTLEEAKALPTYGDVETGKPLELPRRLNAPTPSDSSAPTLMRVVS